MNSQHTKTIKWGIIGLGKIANKFASDIAATEGAELYAVASRNLEKATKFAKKHKATMAFGSYEELAKSKKVDAIYIATPHSLHKDNTLLCLKHKKAVLCEKPFALNSKEVSEMIAYAKANNVLLMEALWTYFLPHYQYVLKLLQGEKYGKVLKLETEFGFKPTYDIHNRLFDKSLGGGSLLDIGIYSIFSALSTLGLPKNIEANATFFKNGADSSCTMRFNYDKATAYLKSTFLEQLKNEAIFTCEKGIIKINTPFHIPTTVTLIPNDGDSETLDFNVTTFGYHYEILHFNELLRGHKTESEIMSFDFSEKLMHLLDSVKKDIGLSYSK